MRQHGENKRREYNFELIWPKQPHETAGEGCGVAIDAHGYIYYLHRGTNSFGASKLISENAVIKLDPATGTEIARLCGGCLVSPHGITADALGNIWITDTALNKVLVFSKDGILLRTYGRDYPFYQNALLRIRGALPRFPAFDPPDMFARPTDLCVLPDSRFLASDGYRNRRIALFDSGGNLLWEVNGFGRGNGQFNLPHGITVDNEGHIYVADRKNARVQVFNMNGRWLSTWDSKEIGRPFAVYSGKDGFIYVADGGDSLDVKNGEKRSAVLKCDRGGKVVASFGSWGEEPGRLAVPHGIAVDEAGSIYVAELKNKRLQKLIPL